MTRMEPLNGAVVRLGGLPASHDSVVVLLFDDGRPVLVRNRFRAWEFPGGHVEPGEGVEETARREAREEAGAELGPVRIAGYYVLANGHTTVVTHAEVVRLRPLTGRFETTEVRSFDVLPPDLSWDDGLYAHLLTVLGLPGAPEGDEADGREKGRARP
ncbi:NUDIX domain-containing protein [Marinactinospora thermotolerans]|uniref:8-oxo-dGTP diphosphatase n=1 Tax=Marinactinospora thermotolerans DSM 45154 TaxID=1122192 RepID=A0A1T4S0X7_9ACTN|nr:NUDIX domain-containing protein [Marinactinospora thermotolerans]SKA21817.1 8-oxo-dGTP diphosphatase [Marinactinospora thermotolerans DSM 45154]